MLSIYSKSTTNGPERKLLHCYGTFIVDSEQIPYIFSFLLFVLLILMIFLQTKNNIFLFRSNQPDVLPINEVSHP